MSDDKRSYDAWLSDLQAQPATSAKPEVPVTKPQKAVAIKYERGSPDAPRVVASGQGAVAEQIMQLAFAHDVKVREDAQLVEILSLLEVDSPIPLEAFAAVAEILTYVYRANARYRSAQ